MNDLILSSLDAKENESEDYHRDLAGAVMDLAQSISEVLARNKTLIPEQFISVMSGKIGGVFSVAILFDKYSKGEDTLSDWLGAASDISLVIAGYTGNPFIAGLATALGIASFLTSDGAKAMGLAFLDAIQNFGLPAGENGDVILLPPQSLAPNPPTCPNMDLPQNTPSPIILDLDGDGIETRSLDDGIFFDHDDNQFAENTGWVGVDDGLLVMDINHNGKIDTGRELFGNNTKMSDGSLAQNGYEALQELDSNHDGIINNVDDSWKTLQVWQDRNGNGQVDDGELFSLEAAGVAAINTQYEKSTLIDKQGNAHKQTGTITMVDGAVHDSTDVWFAANTGYTRYTGDVNVPHEVRQLPFIRGFGNMADLHVAMTQNEELRKMVERYISDPQGAEASELFQDIIFAWAGVSDVAENGRGNYIDGRRLAVLEAATGDNYLNLVNGSVDPLMNAANLLNAEYNRFQAYVKSCLLAQSLFKEDFSYIDVQINESLTGMTLNFDAFEAHLEELKFSDVERYLRIKKTFYYRMEYQPAFEEERKRLGLESYSLFMGGEGNDSLKGTGGGDYFWGGAGNDKLSGGYGSDTYLFNAGDGQDTIEEDSSNNADVDTLLFGEGLLAENVILSRSSRDLLISFRDSTDCVRLSNYFSSESNRYRVEKIAFADGTVWDVDAVKAMLIVGTEEGQTLVAYAPGSEIHAAGGNDSLTGGKGADKLYGDEGDDNLWGDGGDDVLAGGIGNDKLSGGYGSDTYLFNAGDGQDTIEENNSYNADVDTLLFGEGLLAENVILSRSSRDLLISFRDSTDCVRLSNYFSSESNRYRVEKIAFADGTDWYPEDILNHLENNIPLPIAPPVDTPVSLSLVREQMTAFMASDEGDDEGNMEAMPTLTTSRSSVNTLMRA